MKLSGADCEKLVKSMLQVYPNKSDLEQMVRFKLDQSLDAIARGKTTTEIIYSLINDWAEPQGKLQDLLNAVLKDRPDNNELQKTVKELLEIYFNKISNYTSFCVDRKHIESDCYQTILKPGSLIRIKAPYQMGKTSLMYKIISYAKEHGYKTLVLDIQLADKEILDESNLFARWFCEVSSQELEIPQNMDNYWSGVSDNYNITRYFQKYLLKSINTNLVLALDNVDLIFDKHIANDFCGLLRGWNQKAAGGEQEFKNLHLIIVHSTEVYSSLNINQSPLANVGLTVDLPELSFEEICDLVKQYQLSLQTREIRELMNVVGGHPYLIKEALEQVAKQKLNLKYILEIAHTEEGIYGDHLRRLLMYLEEKTELLNSIKKVISNHNSVQLNREERFQLHRMGLVILDGNRVKIRCNLYKKYFSDCLGVSV